jgi:hypothetical protein
MLNSKCSLRTQRIELSPAGRTADSFRFFLAAFAIRYSASRIRAKVFA